MNYFYTLWLRLCLGFCRYDMQIIGTNIERLRKDLRDWQARETELVNEIYSHEHSMTERM